jgi:ATP-dependent Clp protease adapter protein ClpS
MDVYELYTVRHVPKVTVDGSDDDKDRSDDKDLYEVRMIDNDYNTYQEVIDITMLVLGIDQEDAFAVAWEVDHYGSCAVAEGSYEASQSIANLIRTIGIEVQVNPVNRGLN